MGCYLTVLAEDVNGSIFDKDDVIGVYPEHYVFGKSFHGNPRFKIIKSDMDIKEAQSLLEPELNEMEIMLKKRRKTLDTTNISVTTKDGLEPILTKAEIVDRVTVKPVTVIEQQKETVVG